ncbi:undecaprenyl-phosphate glucose phosphotransferase [Bosea sp. (in: a-proteobacteria)]|uniref:undecaprenyl-phosphate glucose phosphotransferase n=1 Tax=Bosea sp. (in: a-proteobacteria) TaxID=1871050 RepID=UPI002602FEB5|nr:undecaprenyl-phosphate glucose phosphotransferase [Bosea sp. (in: a-proteobacteria)]MCO5093553.1 undecaprenyl-phosphate glucose phosphotransferase [Bosea sp. (in: a-proteobacteria)]
MSIDHLSGVSQTAPGRRPGLWRLWIGPLTAAGDAAVVAALVYGMSFGYYLAATGMPGIDRSAPELAAMLATLFVFVNLMRGRYRIGNYLSTQGQMGSAVAVWNITLLVFVVLLFLAKIADHYSRAVIVATYLGGIPVIALSRAAVVRLIAAGSRAGRITAERAFLIGREANVMAFVSRHKPWLAGFSVNDVAFLKPGGGAAALAADLAAAVARCRRERPDAVFIAVPWSEQETVSACVDAFQNLPVAIHLAPEPSLARFANARVVHAGTLSSLRLTRRPLSTAEIAAKRAFDIVAASCGLVLSLPLLLLIAALIRLDSPGPVLFRQRRYGFNQQAFRIFKFRTMTTIDDGQVVVQARKGDPRITRLGALLRRYNLDELPQFLNVLAGDMSLVGPRPHALAHDVAFQRKIANYARRHNVKPGITGWAQVNGLRGETDTDEKMAERIAYDHWYIDNWSFWLDIGILFRTVLSRKAFANAR